MSCCDGAEELCKSDGEHENFSFDMSARLSEGETLANPVITSALLSGATSDLTIGSPTVNGNFIEFTISGGTAGKKYDVNLTVDTSLSGRVLEAHGILKVTK